MYHSITFGDKNTWDDYHLAPTSRPVFNPPALKTNIINLPGSNGSLDLSEALTGYPLYENRKGSIEFAVANDYEDWIVLYSRLMNDLHGKQMRIFLEDEPDFFYYGRITVNSWESNNDGTWSTVTIDYDLNPYKWGITTSTEDWLWDPFSFITGVIRPAYFKDIEVESSSDWTERTFEEEIYDQAPVCPEFMIHTEDGSGMDVRFVNESLDIDETKHLPDGISQIYEWMFVKKAVSVYFKGKGTVSLEFRNGRL